MRLLERVEEILHVWYVEQEMRLRGSCCGNLIWAVE